MRRAVKVKPAISPLSTLDQSDPAETMQGAPKARLYVVAYDVRSNRRRLKLARMLRGYGERVQRSVFECILNDRQYHELRRRADRVIDEKTDSIRYYTLGNASVAEVDICGIGPITSVPMVYIV